MPRYFNKRTRTEAIAGFHDIEDDPDVVELTDDNVFFQPLEPGKRLTEGADGLPNGTEDIPLPPAGSDAAILMAAGTNNITHTRILMALMRAHRGNSTSIDNINANLATIAQNHSTTVEYIMDLMDS